MDAKEAFGLFKQEWSQARVDKTRTSEAGRLLSLAVEVAGKTGKDIEKAGFVDRTSIVRWLKGRTLPHQAQVNALERFLIPHGADHRSLAMSLLDARYRPVIILLLEEEAVGRNMSEEQLVQVLDLVSTSKGKLTPGILRIFLGIEE